MTDHQFRAIRPGYHRDQHGCELHEFPQADGGTHTGIYLKNHYDAYLYSGGGIEALLADPTPVLRAYVWPR